MARQVLPIVGAVVGAFFGAPQLGFAIGSLIGNAVDPLEVQGNKIGDNPLQTAAEGGARAIVFGKGCIRATCILERGNRIVRKTRDQAGKGGGPVTINERVFWTFAIGLGEDLIGGAILRIWEGEKLVYDVTPTSSISSESAEFAAKFRFYDGAETQLPDPDLEVIHGVGEAPYYRGTAYVVFPNFDLTDYRESIPPYRWEVARATASGGGIAMAFRRSDTDAYFRLIPPTWESSWEGATELYAAGEYAVTNGSRVLTYLNSVAGFGINPPAYTDNLGAVWTDSLGDPAGASGGVRHGWMDDQDLLIPGGIDPMLYSPDAGTNLAEVPESPISNAITKVGGRWLSLYHGSGGIRHATDPEGPWSAEFPSGLAITAQPCCWSSGALAMFGGSVGFPHQPGIISTVDGETVNLQSLPSFVSATTITCLMEHEGIWIAGTDSGEVAVRIGGLWSMTGFNLGVACRDMGYTGNEFVLIGGHENGGETIGRIASSVNGLDDWQIRVSETLEENDIWSSIVGITGASSVIGDPIPLSTIVASIHDRCGQDASNYNVSELTDMVSGVVYEQSVTGAEAINSIIGGYFADPSDYDKQVHYIKRGKPVIRTLDFDDLINLPDTSQRENTIEYPKKLHLFFQSSITAYAATKATSARSSPDYNVKGEVSVSIPVTFDSADEPAQISAKLHKVNWTDAEGEIEWEVSDSNLDLVPTDCVGLILRGVVRRARITRIMDENGWRKLTMRVDRQSAYTSNVTGIPLPTPTPPQPSILAPTINAYMDIPALRDSDDLASPVYYDGMAGANDFWPGAVLQRSLDGGASYVNVTAATVNAIMGILQEKVTDASPYYTDTTNQVIVQLYMDDEIESISNTAFLSEQGAFALSWEDSGVRHWEVMQYRDAEQDSSGNWVLTTLHRGRLNSETAEHPQGSMFVLLDMAVRVVNAQSAWINTDLTHRAVTNGLSPETATEETESFTALSQTEWPVAHLFLEIDSAGDLTATAVPRHRFGTALNPIRSINWTGYRWSVTDGSNTISREGTSDVEIFDTSGWASPITVTVSQINRITGLGPSVSESIP